jgi:hypothetical protein
MNPNQSFQNKYRTFSEKSSPYIRASSEIKKKLSKVNNHSTGEN